MILAGRLLYALYSDHIGFLPYLYASEQAARIAAPEGYRPVELTCDTRQLTCPFPPEPDWSEPPVQSKESC